MRTAELATSHESTIETRPGRDPPALLRLGLARLRFWLARPHLWELSKLPGLDVVLLAETPVTDAGIAALKTKLPRLRIVR